MKSSWAFPLLFLFALGAVSSQSAMDLFSALTLLTGLVVSFRTHNWSTWKTPLNYFLLLAFVHVALSYYWNQVPWTYSGPGLLEFVWMIVLVAFTVAWRVTPPERYRWFLIPIFLGGFYSVFTYAMGYSPLHQTVADREANMSYIWRSGGFMNDAMGWSHTAGPLAAITIAVTFYAWFFARNAFSRKTRWVLLGTSALMFLTVIFTMTRGVWFGVALCLPFAIATLNWRKGIYAAAAVVLISLAVVQSLPQVKKRAASTMNYEKTHDSERLVLWRANFEMVKDDPWFGLGYGENRRRLREYYDRLGVREGQFESHAHNQLIHFAAGTGIPGALLYASLILVLVWMSMRLAQSSMLKREHLEAAVMLGIMAAFIAFALDGLTESNFSIAKNRYLFVLLAGLVLSRWRPELWRLNQSAR